MSQLCLLKKKKKKAIGPRKCRSTGNMKKDFERRRGNIYTFGFSVMGGAGAAAGTFLKRLADTVATKKSTTYAQALGWLRCCLSFALLCSSLPCLRWARSIRPLDAPPEPRHPNLAMFEAQMKSA